MHEYTVELRISGSDLDPALITEEFGLRPSMVRHAGEVIGSKRAAIAVWGYNGSQSDSVPIWQSLEEGLTFVLSKVSHIKPQLEQYRKNFEVFWWCGHFQSSFDGGPTLSASLLKELGEFGAAVFIDTYRPEEGETGT
jgi:hypothetical protein